MSRFQQGSIRKRVRGKGAVWVLRFYATRDHDGKRVERTLTVGSTRRFPSESSAWAEIERRRLRERINEPGRVGAVTFGQLVAHYTEHELADQSLAIEPRSHTTVSTYLRVLRLRILPRWGLRIATSIKPLEVEQWLKALKSKEGLANPTLAKTRNVMSLVFRHGIRHSLIQGGEGSNPVQYVLLQVVVRVQDTLACFQPNIKIVTSDADVSDAGLKSASLKKYPTGTVLLSSRAPIGYLAIARNEVTTNQGFKSFIPNNGYSTAFIYYTVKGSLKAIVQYASGSTFHEISASVLKTVKIVLPASDIIDQFTKTVTPIFQRQNLLEQENQHLTQLRDWLLPMLMNGQVSVT